MNIQRHIGIINTIDYKDYTISVIGCGAIGSGITEILVRLGFENFELIDPDVVEDLNLPNQLYFDNDKNKDKVEACKNKILLINPKAKVIVKKEKFKTLNGEMVFLATDNMAARKEVFDFCKEHNDKIKILIDGRMAALTFTVHTVDTEKQKDKEDYERRWFPDEKMLQLPCTEKSIIFNVFGVSSFMGNQLIKFLNQEPYDNFVTFDYKTMTFAKL